MFVHREPAKERAPFLFGARGECLPEKWLSSYFYIWRFVGWDKNKSQAGVGVIPDFRIVKDRHLLFKMLPTENEECCLLLNRLAEALAVLWILCLKGIYIFSSGNIKDFKCF